MPKHEDTDDGWFDIGSRSNHDPELTRKFLTYLSLVEVDPETEYLDLREDERIEHMRRELEEDRLDSLERELYFEDLDE